MKIKKTGVAFQKMYNDNDQCTNSNGANLQQGKTTRMTL